MQTPHAILIPFPIQGHINPMMQLAWKLISHGFIVTFINTDFNHQRIIRANNYKNFTNPCCSMLRMVSVPDGLPQQDGRKDFVKLLHATESSLGPSVVHKLVQESNEREEKQKVTCIIADYFLCCGLSEVATINAISLAVFHASLVSICAIRFFSSRLVALGILPPDGFPKEDKVVKYLPSLPPLHSSYLPWLSGGEYLFQMGIRVGEELRRIKWILFNSVYDLEAPVVDDFSKEVGAYPIGPLIPSQFPEDANFPPAEFTTSLWADQLECLEWLDKQCAQSVIYVSFGSLAVFNNRQVEELAVGLEATQRPFLWVVREDLVDGRRDFLPLGFLERIKDRGCIVSWAPQSRVLSHPSVACFVTHCGWNSTEESLAMGVPMLCLPCFADQFVNVTYIVDVWKVGLALETNEDGIVGNVEFTTVVRRLLVDEEGREIRKAVDKWKMTVRNAVKKGGSSYNNFNIFVNAIKQNTSAI